MSCAKNSKGHEIVPPGLTRYSDNSAVPSKTAPTEKPLSCVLEWGRGGEVPLQPRESGGGETLLMLAVLAAVRDEPNAEEIKVGVLQLISMCPVGYDSLFLDAQADDGNTALAFVILAAASYNEKHKAKIHDGSKSPLYPDNGLLSALLAAGADPFLPGRNNALAVAVSLNYVAASKTLFRQMKRHLNDAVLARKVANTGFVNFEPFELFITHIRRFPLKPGASLVNLVTLSRGVRSAARLMTSMSTEVQDKYELVAVRCPLVIFALLQTLDVNQLYSLLITSRKGAHFLLQAVAYEMGTDLDAVLASDQVFVIVDKRWNGALIRTITRRNAGDGSYIPMWKVALLLSLLFLVILPANLLLLPFVVAFPPLKLKVREWLSDAPISFLKRRLEISLKWRACYLLDTPRITFALYVLSQFVFVALYLSVPLPQSSSPPPAVMMRVTLCIWSLLNVASGLHAAVFSFNSWGSDWLNFFELPAMIISFIGLASTFFVGDELTPDGQPALRHGNSERAVALCLFINVQGLRLL